MAAAVLAWIHLFRNRRVDLFCDNKSVVDMINITSTSCKNCMVLLRLIVLKGLVENVRIFARHVPGEQNGLADSLSRDKFGEFNKLCKQANKVMDDKPTRVPEALWPINKLWKI